MHSLVCPPVRGAFVCPFVSQSSHDVHTRLDERADQCTDADRRDRGTHTYNMSTCTYIGTQTHTTGQTFTQTRAGMQTHRLTQHAHTRTHASARARAHTHTHTRTHTHARTRTHTRTHTHTHTHTHTNTHTHAHTHIHIHTHTHTHARTYARTHREKNPVAVYKHSHAIATAS